MRTILVFALTFAYFYYFDNDTSVEEEVTQDRYERSIYFKMPLDTIEYHWEFLDRKKFLEGDLMLTFTSEGKTIKETVFSKGKLNSNWKVIDDNEDDNLQDNIIYFCFRSDKKYWLTPEDTATLTFSNPNDQRGWGADFYADFPAGKYSANADHFELYEDDTYDTKDELLVANAYIAVDDWKDHWALTNQVKPGWSQE
jgi:hypothetical protein